MQLADYVITRDFPQLGTLVSGADNTDIYQQWFREILRTTADTVAQWQRVGFVHAVMNTDNMSILGQTIDYGPYGWLEEYDPRWTPNYVDNSMRRYCYGNQPDIALWNLYRLANAIIPLFESTEPLKDVLGEYRDTYDQIWNQILADKTGIKEFQKSDNELYDSLWSTLRLTATDFTIFFRQLAKISPDTKASEIRSLLLPALYKEDEFKAEVEAGFMQWITQWQKRIAAEDPAMRVKTMNATLSLIHI